jgi:metallo-beta-lactamase class B
MGGVISLYAVMRYPDIFGGAGIFSPAFWTAEGLAQDVRKFAPGMHARIYFYAGDAESKNMVSNMQAIVKMLRSNPAVKTKVAIAPGGKHNEANWHAAFPAFYQWILDR